MSSNIGSLDPLNPNNEHSETKVYAKRWLILFIFSSVSFLSAFNWIEHNIIQNLTIDFYNQSLPQDETEKQSAVNWFSMVYMLVYIPLVFPAMFFLDRKGLKLAVILGGLLNTAGSVIKCFAVRPDLFLVAMLGQTICGIGQAFTLSIPARLSALWFGTTQVALATSIGVFGNQLGAAIGFLLPPNIVSVDDSIDIDIDKMKTQFYYLYIGVASLSFLFLILTIIFVKDQPEIPPSKSQLEIRRDLESKSENNLKQNDFLIFRTSFMNLIKNMNFLLIFLSYGINVGVFYAISTLLNQAISEYYQNENQKIGYFGLILILSGLPGSIIGGIVLDKFKKFKLVTLIFYVGSLVSMVLFTFTMTIDINIIFGTITLLGFFMSGYLPVGFELATEVTYPEPEGLACGLLNTSAQIFGLLFTYAQGRIITSYSAKFGNIFLCGALTIGSILTALVRSDLRRQNAQLRETSQVEPINNEDIS